MGSSWARYWTHVPCTGRQFLIHCTWEVPKLYILNSLMNIRTKGQLVAWCKAKWLHPYLHGKQNESVGSTEQLSHREDTKCRNETTGQGGAVGGSPKTLYSISSIWCVILTKFLLNKIRVNYFYSKYFLGSLTLLMKTLKQDKTRNQKQKTAKRKKQNPLIMKKQSRVVVTEKNIEFWPSGDKHHNISGNFHWSDKWQGSEMGKSSWCWNS